MSKIRHPYKSDMEDFFKVLTNRITCDTHAHRKAAKVKARSVDKVELDFRSSTKNRFGHISLFGYLTLPSLMTVWTKLSLIVSRQLFNTKSIFLSFHFFQMDLNGPNGNAHYRGIHHQHDEVRLIDYACLCEHLSPRKIILLQLFRTIFHRLVNINW
jgi:hypothetical protein